MELNTTQDCERCGNGKITAVVSSELMTVQVCIHCAIEAAKYTGPAGGELEVIPITRM